MVLDDHVKKGRKLLPKMLAEGHPIARGEWMMDRLPNHFWISWLIEELGLKDALKHLKSMSTEMTQLIQARRSNEDCFRAHILNDHQNLTEAEMKFLKGKTKGSRWRLEVEPVLRDICSLFEDFPIRYLVFGRISRTTGKEQRTSFLSNLLAECSHRHDKLALHTQAAIFVVEVECGSTTFAHGLDIPDVNAILDYLDTEESQRAAGFLVSFCGSMTAMQKKTGQEANEAWPRSFWNTCYRLEPGEHYVE